MQISMANVISRTLTKEQAGVGMGIFSMLGFIYSNIYLMMTLMHVCLMVFYYFQFGRAKRQSLLADS
ncbi:hypothetical protein EMIT07CA2_170096 [Brevibacillus sp. IT-7CA2]